MEVLPAEIFDEICGLVYANKDVKLAQRTFYGLALASKALNVVATPWLYRRPVLTTNKRKIVWERTYLRLINPWSLCGVKRGVALSFQPTRIIFKNRARLPDIPNYLLSTLVRDASHWPDLALFRTAGILDKLVSLAIDDPAEIPSKLFDLIAPGTALRTRLKYLKYSWPRKWAHFEPTFEVFFLLQALEVLDPVTYTKVDLPDVDYPDSYYVMNEEVPAWNAHLPVQAARTEPQHSTAPLALIKRAHFDSETFFKIFYIPDLVSAVEGPAMLDKPPSSFPFLHLVGLTLPVENEQHLFLIFYTGIFPSLRRLELHGGVSGMFEEMIETMRFSVFGCTSPKLVPPRLYAAIEDNDEVDAEHIDIEPWDDGTWSVMIEEEMEDYPFKPYRGPQLEKLDMGRLDVKPFL